MYFRLQRYYIISKYAIFLQKICFFSRKICTIQKIAVPLQPISLRRCHRLSVRTRDFHSLKRGSIPRGTTINIKIITLLHNK